MVYFRGSPAAFASPAASSLALLPGLPASQPFAFLRGLCGLSAPSPVWLRTSLESWQGLPWIVIIRSVSTFVRCGLCDNLTLLIERCSRTQDALRETYENCLGVHFQFQGAQRLAQGQLEEECAHSEGRKWFAKFDKMDNKKVVRTTLVSQLATTFFKDLNLRLVTGILGPCGMARALANTTSGPPSTIAGMARTCRSSRYS